MAKVSSNRQTAQLFRALMHPLRRQVLAMFTRRPGGELSAKQIAQAFPQQRSGVARHVRLLFRSGLLRERVQGRQRFYRLEPEPLRRLDAWLETYRPYWRRRPALAAARGRRRKRS